MGFRMDNLERMLDILEADANVDAVVLESAATFLKSHRLMTRTLLSKLVDFVSHYKERCQKPFLMILQPWHLEGAMVEIRSKFLQRGVATFAGFRQGANTLSKVISYHRFRAGLE